MEFARVVSEYKLWVQIIQDSSLERCWENDEEERILECHSTTCCSNCHGAGWTERKWKHSEYYL
jgi:hypothetical protein